VPALTKPTTEFYLTDFTFERAGDVLSNAPFSQGSRAMTMPVSSHTQLLRYRRNGCGSFI
jgi:hypothetical protein